MRTFLAPPFSESTNNKGVCSISECKGHCTSPLSSYSETQQSRISHKFWKSKGQGKDSRVEVPSRDAVDQLHDVSVPDRTGWVTHHQLLPGGVTHKRKWSRSSK